MLVSFNPVVSKNRYSNNKSQNVVNKSQNPSFKGPIFLSPEELAESTHATDLFFRSIRYNLVPKDESTINIMRLALAKAEKIKGNVFVPQKLKPVIEFWEKNNRFPDNF